MKLENKKIRLQPLFFTFLTGRPVNLPKEATMEQPTLNPLKSRMKPRERKKPIFSPPIVDWGGGGGRLQVMLLLVIQIETNLKEKAPFLKFVSICVNYRTLVMWPMILSAKGFVSLSNLQPKTRGFQTRQMSLPNSLHFLKKRLSLWLICYYKKRSHITMIQRFRRHTLINSAEGSPASPPRNLTHPQEN